jgi:hypothetical protein
MDFSYSKPVVWRSFGGPMLALACFVHCVGMAVVAPVLPALAQAANSPFLEWGLWLVSAAMALTAARHFDRGRPRAAVIGGTLATTALGLYGLTCDREVAIRLSLLGYLVVQSMTLVRRARVHRTRCCTGANHACD